MKYRDSYWKDTMKCFLFADEENSIQLLNK